MSGGNLPPQERVHIRAVLRGEVRLRHSFRGGGMCKAALRLCVRNCHSSAAASLCIEAGAPSQPGGLHLLLQQPRSLCTQENCSQNAGVSCRPGQVAA